MSERPNVLYIHSHDTGRMIRPYGYDVPTPALQRLAEEGTLFRQAFCATPTCSPSRASLVTGQYGHQHGCMGLAHLGWQLPDFSKHVQHVLGEAGYTTALSGIQHVVHHDRTDEIGYDEVLIPPGVGGSPELSAASWILERAQDNRSEPFFLSVGFGATHREFPTENLVANPDHVKPPSPLPDHPETRRDWAGFMTSAKGLDRKMDVVFRALEEAGQLENTLIICTTDHGPPLPRMKCTLHEEGTGVMLIVRGPGGFTGGKTVDALASHLDIFPTICDVCGVEPPSWLEGASLKPLVDGSAERVRDEVFSTLDYHACYEPVRSIRTQHYKYIRRYDGRTRSPLPNCDDSPSKTFLLERGWYDEDLEGLYHVATDPHEMRNLAERPEMAEILADMRGRLDAWQKRTGDPLLHGPVPAPEEAMLSDVNAVSSFSPRRPASEHPQT